MSTVIGWLIVPPLVWVMRRYHRPGHVRLKCSACESCLYDNFSKNAYTIQLVGWVIFANTFLTWGWKNLLAAVLSTIILICWIISARRLYVWWWMRQHPTRCQGGGHPAPEPTKA